MPYKKAYMWVAFATLLTIPAFWRGYFGRISEVGWELHFHAFTATGWMILLAAQAWAAHRRDKLALHRLLGRASLFFFPVFFSSALLVVWSMAHNTAFGDSIIYEAHGEGLGAYDFLSVTCMGMFYYLALKERRSVHVHARWMIGTLFALIGPMLARLFAIPLFITFGSTQAPPDIFYAALVLAQTVALGIALLLWRGAPLAGKQPMKWVALLVFGQMAIFAVARLSDGWREMFMAMGRTDSAIWLVLGLAIGAAVTWLGWQAGKTPQSKKAAPAMGAAS
ncbi:hypothetical protein [Qipengyuania sphaerica]|uniref:hypothetical protein n=1 Tax=Qipengyuania sphaerica TaxID=2867243 RepID=UPI001C88159F|nr:hypothetical protein [Qipengyuania sphaerica]MBX7539714.1 hypothetical protein [Qipengyuania sphaerica]